MRMSEAHAKMHLRDYVRDDDMDASIKMINDLMEAIHDIPFQLKTWDDSRLDLLRLHLRCFDSTLYPGAPNFLNRFEMLLASYNEEKAEQDVHGNTH